jgi:hypothetical protein
VSKSATSVFASWFYLQFVISTGAKWSGEIWGFCILLVPPTICHLDRSEAQWRDLRFLHFAGSAYNLSSRPERSGVERSGVSAFCWFYLQFVIDRSEAEWRDLGFLHFAGSTYNLSSTGAKRSGEICGLFSPRFAEIRPRRIHLLNQPDLLRPTPSFDLLFPVYRIIDVLETFKPDQAMASVLCRETKSTSLSMLLRTPFKAVCDSAVKNVVSAGDDIDVVMMFPTHLLVFSGLRAK